MTRSEFEELQVRAASSGTSLKKFLRNEGIAYSTYNYWNKKIKAEARSFPLAPISIRSESGVYRGDRAMTGIDLPGVTLAFPNGLKAHFGIGSEAVLIEVLTQSIP